MEALTRLCTLRDPQVSSLRSMAFRRRRALLRYEGFIPPLAFLANVCICGYFQKTMLATVDALAVFFLAESCVAVAVLFVHGSTFIDEIIERSRLLGVSSAKRLLFALLEFGLHPILIAQIGSLVLVWSILLHAGLSALAFALAATFLWYGSLIISTVVVYLLANRYRIRPPIAGAVMGTVLFIMLVGPTVLAGGAPYASIPISGWTAQAISFAVSGHPSAGIPWLFPTIGIPLVLLPFGLRKA